MWKAESIINKEIITSIRIRIVARLVNQKGSAVILKNNTPRYLVIEFSQAEKIQVTVEEKIIDIYNAIFVNKYCGKEYQKTIGKYTFDANAKNFVLSAASMLSRYADYNI